MTSSKPDARSSPNAGFTMIELLIVVAIVAVAAAMSLPAIGRFIRNYQIRGATQQVSGEIQAARNRAISKNVNHGVVFVTLSPTTYQWVVEDDQTGTGAGRSSVRPTLSASFLSDRAQASPVFDLPQNIQFGTTCAGPTLPTGAWDAGMRFNRFGGWCDPTGTLVSCPSLGVGQNFVYNITAGNTAYPGGSVLCVNQTTTGLSRTVTVLPGGRVVAQQ